MGLVGHNPILSEGRSVLECAEGLQCMGPSGSLMTQMTSILGSVSFHPDSFLNGTAFFFFFSVFTTSGAHIYKLKLMQDFSMFFS